MERILKKLIGYNRSFSAKNMMNRLNRYNHHPIRLSNSLSRDKLLIRSCKINYVSNLSKGFNIILKQQT